MSDPWVGPVMICMKGSEELKQMLDAVAAHEQRSVSSVVRRAAALYLYEGGYMDADAAGILASALDKGNTVDETSKEEA